MLVINIDTVLAVLLGKKDLSWIHFAHPKKDDFLLRILIMLSI